MSRFPPRTLFGQMTMILLVGLIISHVAGAWIYAADREKAVRAIGGYAATQRISNITRLIEDAPEDWRGRIATAASDPTLRITLSPQPPAALSAAPDDGSSGSTRQLVHDYLAEQLPDALAARLLVSVARTSGPREGGHDHQPHWMGPWAHRGAGWRGLQAAVQLSDGQWLSFTTALPDAGPSISWQFTIALGVMAVIVVLTSVWAVRRVTAPLAVLARAAERLGHDVKAPPIAETGSREMRQAAHSFNEMQARLQLLLENRTRMLAALSHDLRTPLTLLRLRTEGLQAGDERDRMLATIRELEAMIDATLKLAHDQATAETRRRTDITALLSAIVDDMADAGLPVTMEAAEPVVLECQPVSLRRAIGNLLDNAIKYGNSARVRMLISPATIKIIVDDEGPGIPDADLRRVFEPFYRLEQSRSRDTGGTGLGLAIALSVVQAHGGQITLVNRPEVGLRATVLLPR
jgi:signal transduction histidine kinase